MSRFWRHASNMGCKASHASHDINEGRISDDRNKYECVHTLRNILSTPEHLLSSLPCQTLPLISDPSLHNMLKKSWRLTCIALMLNMFTTYAFPVNSLYENQPRLYRRDPHDVRFPSFPDPTSFDATVDSAVSNPSSEIARIIAGGFSGNFHFLYPLAESIVSWR